MPKRQIQNDVPVDTGIQPFTCKCSQHAQKPRNLVLRPDLAGEEDGHSRLALCIFAKPANVHEWDGSEYVLREDLEFRNNQVVFKENGQVYAASAPPSLAELDVDDEPETEPPAQSGGSQPQTGDHVDLDRDSYY